jgi:hypothetical protein
MVIASLSLAPIPAAGANYTRAFCGETLTAAAILETGRRIILVAAPRRIVVEEFAMIELPPAAEWARKYGRDRDLLIVGTQFLLSPHARELIRGDNGGRHNTRLVPLVGDCGNSDAVRDGWAAM